MANLQKPVREHTLDELDAIGKEYNVSIDVDRMGEHINPRRIFVFDASGECRTSFDMFGDRVWELKLFDILKGFPIVNEALDKARAARDAAHTAYYVAHDAYDAAQKAYEDALRG